MTSRLALPVLALLAVASFTVSGPALADPAGFVRVRADTVNLRERPSTRADRVTFLYEDDPLQVLGRRDGWLKVRDFRGYEGWVSGGLIDRRPSVVVRVRAANVRSGPGRAHDVLYTADRGVAFAVRATRGEWLEVEHADGARGWVHRRVVWGADRKEAASRPRR
jgi:SH3-like domain-containing protein